MKKAVRAHDLSHPRECSVCSSISSSGYIQTDGEVSTFVCEECFDSAETQLEPVSVSLPRSQLEPVCDGYSVGYLLGHMEASENCTTFVVERLFPSPSSSMAFFNISDIRPLRSEIDKSEAKLLGVYRKSAFDIPKASTNDLETMKKIPDYIYVLIGGTGDGSQLAYWKANIIGVAVQ